MKKMITTVLAVILVTACSRNFEKFELFSAESFAYSMDSGWELNASVRAKGFDQEESNSKFTAKLSYSVDIQTPDGKLKKNVSSGIVDKTAPEKMTDLPIEIQINLDSAYIPGTYRINFYVKDEGTGNEAKSFSFFELTK